MEQVKLLFFDIVFCVANGIRYLNDKVVYDRAFIKKRWYWPNHFPSGLIGAHFADKYIDQVDMLETKLSEGKEIYFLHEGTILCYENYGYMDEYG